jgi:hypothetical protein
MKVVAGEHPSKFIFQISRAIKVENHRIHVELLAQDLCATRAVGF